MCENRWRGARVFVLRESERAVGIRLALWGRWPLCDQTLKPLCHPANPMLWQVCHFSKWFRLQLNTSISFCTPFAPLTYFFSFSESRTLIFFFISFSLFFFFLRLQLPSPTAMSTALRGISCYLREVITWLLCFGQPNPASVCPSVLTVHHSTCSSFKTHRSRNILPFKSNWCWNKQSFVNWNTSNFEKWCW